MRVLSLEPISVFSRESANSPKSSDIFKGEVKNQCSDLFKGALFLLANSANNQVSFPESHGAQGHTMFCDSFGQRQPHQEIGLDRRLNLRTPRTPAAHAPSLNTMLGFVNTYVEGRI